MSSTACSYQGNRDEAIVAYIYGEIDAPERASFEAHVRTCLVCRREIDDIGGVRAQLAHWSPPGNADLQPVVNWLPHDAGRASAAADARTGWWREVPVWAQTAAALLVLGVALGAANLSVHYDGAHGLSITTGWMRTAATAAPSDAASRADLVALRDELNGQIRATAATEAARAVDAANVVAPKTTNDADIMRKVHALVDSSAKMQESELALRIVQLSREMQTQRLSDLNNIDRMVRGFQRNTGSQMQLQNEVINSLAYRVSQTK
jgi:hypothetical protein